MLFSIFILKALGTGSSFLSHYLDTYDCKANSIIYFGLLILESKRQFNPEGGTEDALCFLHWWLWRESFVSDSPERLYISMFPRLFHLNVQFNNGTNKKKKQLVLFSMKSKVRLYKAKPNVLFRCYHSPLYACNYH